jgi:hypothetical protein
MGIFPQFLTTPDSNSISEKIKKVETKMGNRKK